MSSLDSPSTIADTVTAMQSASRMKKAHFLPSQQLAMIDIKLPTASTESISQPSHLECNYRNLTATRQFFAQLARQFSAQLVNTAQHT